MANRRGFVVREVRMLQRFRIGTKPALVALTALAPTAVVVLTVAAVVTLRRDPVATASNEPLGAFVVVAGVLLAATAVAGLALVRSIRRPVVRLTDAANATATDELPRLVSVIDRAGPDDPLPELEPIEAGAQDDLADLARAFDSVRATAVQLAAGQASARRALAEMFVNLGRRNQALIARQLAFIDQLERNEEDPDTLEDLFRLDHLATRMRRNAESLLVLAGAEQARRWSESSEIGTVVRSALSEIEDYHQVELGDLEGVDARGAVAADLAHLLAELMENATAFSPPTSPVRVTGRFVSEGYVLSIVDSGVGMDPLTLEEANRRLTEVAQLERTPTRVLGLYVVGRLAARHDIKVRLVATPERGVTARVLLPASAIERRAHQPERSTSPDHARRVPGAPPRRSERAPSPRPVDIEPLAMPPVPSRSRADGSAELLRRVRGAQHPDTGPAPSDDLSPPRSADEVRAMLDRFHAGVARGAEQGSAGADVAEEGP